MEACQVGCMAAVYISLQGEVTEDVCLLNGQQRLTAQSRKLGRGETLGHGCMVAKDAGNVAGVLLAGTDAQ